MTAPTTPTVNPAPASEPEYREYEVSITNHFTASSPAEAAAAMQEWLIAHGGAANGAYQVTEDEIDAEVVTVDGTDL